MPEICETCGKEIKIDFRLLEYRDRSKDSILYGIQTRDNVFHYYCCPEHINRSLLDGQPN